MRLQSIILCSVSTLVLACAPAWARAEPSGPQAASSATPVGAQASGLASPDARTPAADAQDPSVSEVVVTGYRESIRSAANLKRNAPQVVDAVVAEDIGKLPDLAVSDTAARIPGVQVIRLGGEASSVLIRGLGETFFNTLYNGREIFTAERRQVSLQDFPSAGIAALEIFKTSTADQVEPGVIGLTNVRSRRPFDFKGLEIAGNVWGMYTAEARGKTPNGNILISDRFQTGIGEIGVLVNASYTDMRYLDSEPSNTDFIASPNINGQAVRMPDIQRLFYRSGERERPSGNAAIQWRPNDKFEFYVEGLYQGFRNKINDTRADANLYGGQQYTNIVLRPGTNLVSSGTVINPAGSIFSFRGGTYNKTDTYQIATGGSYDSGPLHVTVDVAHNTSRFTGSTESLDRVFGLNGYTVNFNNDVPQFSISGFDPADPANYRFLGLFEEAQVAKGGDWQSRIDAEYKFGTGFLRSVQFGFRYTDRDAHREYGNRYFGGQNVPITQIPVDYALVQSGFQSTDIQPFRTFLAPSYDSIRDNILNLRQLVIGLGAGNYTLANVAPDAFSSYEGHERTYAGYGQANYRFGDAIDGTVGLRVVRAQTRVDGATLLAGVVTPVSSGPESTAYLPNASARWKILPDLQLRLSYTKTQTRPDFSQLNPAFSVGSPVPFSSGGTIRIGGGGNPDLKPYKSNNYDASLEYYFSRVGSVAVTAFRRDISNYIEIQTRQLNDPTFGLVQLDQPVNVSKVRIDGAEAQISTFFDFDFVPTFLRSFGFQANYTYIDQKPALLGVSKNTYNLVGLYEQGPLSTRLTWNKRSRFLDSSQNRGNDLFLQYGHLAGTLDLSANLAVRKNLTLFFDATNLTGDADTYDFSSARDGAPRADFVRFLRFTERTFSAGLRFRFG